MAEEEDDKCKKCLLIVDSDGIECDRCLKWFHIKCAKMSKEQYEMHVEMKDCFWFCVTCKIKVKKYLATVNEKDEIMEVLTKIQTDIKEIKDKNAKTELSYADVAKMISNNSSVKSSINIHKPKSTGGLIITSKNPSTTKSQSIEEIKNKIDLTKIGVGVTLKPCYRGEGCFMSTFSNVDSVALEKKVNEQLGDQFTVRIPTEKRPQLILNGVKKDYTEEELAKEIILANQGFNEEEAAYIKVVHKRLKKTMNGNQSWEYIIESNESTFGKLLDRYILIDFNYHFIKRFVNVTRCFNCQKYHHKATECVDNAVCAVCMGNHSSKDCKCTKQEYKCINCVEANSKGGKYKVNHICGTRQCGFLQNMIINQRSNATSSSKW